MSQSPRIKVVCKVYNEAFLLPFFLKHYRFADQIHVLLTPSNDMTQAVVRSASWANVIDEEVLCPDGIDDRLLNTKLNEVLARPTKDFDWFMVVDVDELIWPFDGLGVDLPITPPRVQRFLSQVPQDIAVLEAKMYQVYRHKTDSALALGYEPVTQRRHGNPDRQAENGWYIKPSVFRTNLGIQLTPGQHALQKSAHPVADWPRFDGAHWAMADESFCITRRCRDRRDRLSQVNKQNNFGIHVFDAKEQELLDFCRARENSPRVF